MPMFAETPEYLWNGLVNLKADCVIAEHLQRAVLWPGYPTLQPSSLHMGSQPAATAQHIQLFEPSEPADLLCGQGETTRILVQPQFALAETPAKRKATVIKASCSFSCFDHRLWVYHCLHLSSFILPLNPYTVPIIDNSSGLTNLILSKALTYVFTQIILILSSQSRHFFYFSIY